MDDSLTLQQNDLLRDIRDEIRTSRGVMSSGAGGLPTGNMSRPNATFLQSQLMADKITQGNWANFSWSLATNPTLKTSFTQDILGAWGVLKSPSNMTQMQYQQLASESWRFRAGSFVSGFIAPEYTSQTTALANDIFANSQRFARFGDGLSGVFGFGAGYGASTQLAQRVQHLAINDLRLSSADYTNIAKEGIQSGQYNNVRSMGEFEEQTKRLAKVTGDLAAALHLSTQEVIRSTSNLRQMGVQDPADQRRFLMQASAAAQVAGLTSGEVLSMAGPAMELSMQMGAGALSGGNLAIQNVAAIRDLSRSGVLSQSVLAANGGVEGYNQKLTRYQLQFANSNTGYYMARGGGSEPGANAFTSLMTGVGNAMSGGLTGVFDAEYDKARYLENETADQKRQGLRNLVNQQLGILHIDPLSKQARSAIYSIVDRYTGGDSNFARAYADSEGTEEGRRVSAYAALKMQQSTMSTEGQLMADAAFRHDSFAGKFTASVRGIADIGMSVLDYGRNVFGSGADVGAQYVRQAMAPGTTPYSFDDYAAMGAQGLVNAPSNYSLRVSAPNSGAYSGMGRVIGMGVGGAAVAAMLGPVGWGVGALVLGGSLLGGQLGMYAGAGVEAKYGNSDIHMEGQQAINYIRASQGGSLSLKDEADLQRETRDSRAARDLMSNIDTGLLSPRDSLHAAKRLGTIQDELKKKGFKIGGEDVTIGQLSKYFVGSRGQSLAASEAEGIFTSAKITGEHIKEIQTYMYGRNAPEGLNYTSSETLRAQSDLLTTMSESRSVSEIEMKRRALTHALGDTTEAAKATQDFINRYNEGEEVYFASDYTHNRGFEDSRDTWYPHRSDLNVWAKKSRATSDEVRQQEAMSNTRSFSLYAAGRLSNNDKFKDVVKSLQGPNDSFEKEWRNKGVRDEFEKDPVLKLAGRLLAAQGKSWTNDVGPSPPDQLPSYTDMRRALHWGDKEELGISEPAFNALTAYAKEHHFDQKKFQEALTGMAMTGETTKAKMRVQQEDDIATLFSTAVLILKNLDGKIKS
jgi:hypothetical protein